MKFIAKLSQKSSSVIGLTYKYENHPLLYDAYINIVLIISYLMNKFMKIIIFFWGNGVYSL